MTTETTTESGTPLPKFELAFPGPLRDTLVAAVLSGAKTSTTGLLAGYELENEPLPQPGDRSVMVDSEDRPVAVVEISSVRVVQLSDVDLGHAVDEGEGHTTVEDWRADHETFWHGPESRAELGADFTVTDSTPVVLERFTVVERLDGAAGG